jgi:hypothetical protein
MNLSARIGIKGIDGRHAGADAGKNLGQDTPRDTGGDGSMVRILIFGLGALAVCQGLAYAQGSSQGDGQYVLTQPQHKARVNKIEALTVKQKAVRRDKQPKAIQLCVPPGGGKPRRC